MAEKNSKDKKEQVENVQISKEAEYLELAQRIKAEFENYKKRTAKESLSSYTNGKVAAIEELLPVIDNFDRATEAIRDDDSQLAQGIKMVAKQLYDALDKLGVKPIEAKGKKFDPNLHNAVMHSDDDQYGENIVSEEFQKGYMYRDTVVRYSMVKVEN